MTNNASPTRPARVTACARCGAPFGCDLSGQCWCAGVAFRMPLPDPGADAEDCLCPDCLRAEAARRQTG
jgi:hypothetical protein